MKVSIITIAYNNLEGLKDTYESIRRQTFSDYEWLVVDGGSTDGTKQFLEEHDSELAFWCSEPDKGVYNAQNKGTRHAKGEYCIYMNSGDSFFADDVLEKVFDSQMDADIIYGNWMLVFQGGKTRLGKAPDVADIAYFFDDNGRKACADDDRRAPFRRKKHKDCDPDQQGLCGPAVQI